MRLTPDELVALNKASATGRVPSPPPDLPGFDGEPMTIAMLLRYRRERLAGDLSLRSNTSAHVR